MDAYRRLTKTIILITALALTGVGCNKEGSRSIASDSDKESALKFKSSLLDQPQIIAKNVTFAGEPVSFSIEMPPEQTFKTALWNFGDATFVSSNSLSAVEKIFSKPGYYKVSAEVTNSEGVTTIVNHSMNVIFFFDGLECIIETKLEVPKNSTVGEAVPAKLNILACLNNSVSGVSINFGNGQETANTQAANSVYTEVGTYTIRGEVFSPLATEGPLLVFEETINITPKIIEPDPLDCGTLGATRINNGPEQTEKKSCGLDGTKTDRYVEQITQTCTAEGETRRWIETSRERLLISEGACSNQSCRLANGESLPHLQSLTFYSTPSPNGACSEVASTRTCENGVLNGNELFSHRTCSNGCAGFGPNGTVKTGVVIGEAQIPVTCQFAESGIFSTYNQVADQVCNAGSITNTNVRNGNVKTLGQCPTYQWQGTANYSSCSADCGGQQTRLFECRNNSGEPASPDRCASQTKPVESRLCDGNPEAAKRTESKVTQEEAPSTETCPANQIGVTLRIRNVTTTKTFACLNHQVQLENEAKDYSAWVTEKYCKDYVPHRCSHDSLNNTEAKARLAWMQKCQNEVPAIKEFLSSYEDFQIYSNSKDKKNPGTVGADPKLASGRMLYPTFMDRATSPEKKWLAPKTANASCNVPKTAYVAAVCVSSCATPEQEILVQAKANMKLRYTPFIEALEQNHQFVATLQSQSSMSAKTVVKTKVDTWVTELVDTEHDIIKFTMASGRTLKLTPNHPLVSDDGTMKLASDFAVGDNLVALGGITDQIVSLDQQKHFGKVYNLFVKSNDPHKNIVITNGYLNGTAFFQNEGAKNLNRNLFRKKLTHGSFTN